MRKLFAALAFVFLSALAYGQTTAVVTGNLLDQSETAAASGISVDVELANTLSQRCYVAGTGTVLKEKQTYTAAQITSGITLAKNANITCGLTTGATQWKFTFNNSTLNTHRACNLQISGATNLDSAACLNSSPTPTTMVPTASLFCLIDASNCGFTGNTTHNGHDDTGIGTLGAVTGSFSGPVSTTQVTNTGDTLLSSGKVIKWNADTGLSRDSAGVVDVGNGTQGDASGTVKAAKAQFNPASTTGFDVDVIGNGRLSGGNQSQYCWTSGNANGTTDTGLSRDAAGIVDVGNCTLSDRSGTVGAANLIAPAGASLQIPTVGAKVVSDTATQTLTNKGFGDKITLYNNIATVSNGLASEVATVDLTGQTANIGSTTLYAVPASGAGSYRITVYIIVTTVGTTSTMPNVVIGFTDPDNSTVQSVPYTVSSAGNTLTTLAVNSLPLRAKASTNITYSTTSYASTGTAMQYAVHLKLEVL